MMENKFALEDEAYWADPWINRKAMQRPLMRSGEESFAIGAPEVMALDRHRTLPLAILRVRKAQGGSPVDFRSMAVVAAWDMNLQRLSARLAFPKAPPAPAPKRPAGKPASLGDSFSKDASAMISEASTLDLAARLRLPLAGGEYVISLLCLDKSSNQCRTKLIDSSAYRDEAAEEYLRAYREEQLGPPRIHPEAGKGLTAYGRQPKSPEIPAEVGIALLAQRVTVIRADRPCLLQGSFRLPVRTRPSPVEPGAGAQAQAPTAIVPIGLLLTGSVDATPVILNINAPSNAPLEKAGEEWIATGYFALDLCAHARLSGIVQTYFLYAFSGEVMSGPALAAFVNPVLTWKTREELAKETEAAIPL
jgi:hypothetical protein